ncbi:MAG: hypothetical protein AAF602_28455, partial [Myxococcota bacterium]
FTQRHFAAGRDSSQNVRLRIWDPSAPRGASDPEPGRWFDGRFSTEEARKLGLMLLGFGPDEEVIIIAPRGAKLTLQAGHGDSDTP